MASKSQRDGCRKYNVEACDIALRSSHATQEDMIDLRNWRRVAEKLHIDLDRCRTGSAASCDAALASPAIEDGQRTLLNEWSIADSPFKRAMALLSKHSGMAATAMLDCATVIRNLATSTHVTGGLAAVLALALAAMAFRKGHSPRLANPGDVDNAILNLAINARDAMPNGGTLTIETRHVTLDADAAKRMSNARPGDYVMLTVSDTGRGIAPEDLPRVFERFYRADKSRSTGGNGLGLAISKAVVEAHGGTIEVVSEENAGTTFTVRLPVT